MTDNELIIQYHAGNVEALYSLVKNFKPYMKRLAFKWRIAAAKVGLEETDLQQEGWIAFVKLVEKLGEKPCTCAFSTYAYGAVEFAIRHTICNNRPRGYKSTLKKDNISICSIYKSIFDDGSSDMLVDSIASTSFPPTDNYVEENYKQNLKTDLILLLDTIFDGNLAGINESTSITNQYLLQKLKSRANAEYLLLLHYGLFGDEMTFTDISKITGHSVSILSNLEHTALRKIRRSFEGRQLMKLYEPSYAEKIYDLQMQKKEIYVNCNPEKAVLKLEEIDSKINKYLNL